MVYVYIFFIYYVYVIYYEIYAYYDWTLATHLMIRIMD